VLSPALPQNLPGAITVALCPAAKSLAGRLWCSPRQRLSAPAGTAAENRKKDISLLSPFYYLCASKKRRFLINNQI
jgi:hypothetical protein